MTPEGLRSEVPQYLWRRKHMFWGMSTQWLALFVGGGGLFIGLTSLKHGWWGFGLSLGLTAAAFVLVQQRFRQDEYWDDEVLDDLSTRYQRYYGSE